jgi:hypothetical protein
MFDKLCELPRAQKEKEKEKEKDVLLGCFFIEVVGRVDTGLFCIEHDGDAAMRFLDLCDEV